MAVTNLLSPPILFFALGVAAALLRSDLEIPAPVGKALSLYLMIAIGFKGGVMLSSEASPSILLLAVVAVLIGLLLPAVGYVLLRRTTSISPVDAAAVAAHYGSVSVVTFVTAAAFLETSAIAYAGAMVAVLALMETPAIVSGLLLARQSGANGNTGQALREALVNGSVVLLAGSLAIGWATGDRGADMLGVFLIDPFQGVLALFLLDMGLIVARRLEAFRAAGWRLVAFGLYMPLVGAAVGLAASALLRLSVGDATLLMVLSASASYIAVPAAMRHALPKADPAMYVPLSLGVTFPLNVLVGIPVYHAVARALLG